MTQTNISGPGVGLPIPQNLYPTELLNAPYDFSNNYLTLSPGDAVPIPAGSWFITVGAYSLLQFQDPISNCWRIHETVRAQPTFIKSNGFNFRVANLLGCPIAAIIVNGGSGFAQGTATVTASAGGSTWQAIVGGALSITSITNVGASYTMPPLVFIPAPPSVQANSIGGVQATAYARIANGTVSAVSLVNFGAGYATAPSPIILLPNPTDPNFGSITAATITTALNNAGSITAALCTNNGASLATLTNLTLTAAGGAGAGATITPVVLQTVTGNSVVVGGVSLGNVTNSALVGSVGGTPTSVSTIVNPIVELTGFRPRPYQAQGVCNAGGTITSIGTVFDSGLFANTPTPVVTVGAAGQIFSSLATIASITFTMGATIDTVLLQPV